MYELLKKSNKTLKNKLKKFLTKANEFDKINELLIERTAGNEMFPGSSKELRKII